MTIFTHRILYVETQIYDSFKEAINLASFLSDNNDFFINIGVLKAILVQIYYLLASYKLVSHDTFFSKSALHKRFLT